MLWHLQCEGTVQLPKDYLHPLLRPTWHCCPDPAPWHVSRRDWLGEFELCCAVGGDPEAWATETVWASSSASTFCHVPEALLVDGTIHPWFPADCSLVQQHQELTQTSALMELLAPVLPPEVETMSNGYRYPVRKDRTCPPSTDLTWAGMQWFLRPDRVVHPDDPDLVRVPDPGGGRFREWLGPVLARLTPAQIEQGRTHGF